MNTNSLVLTLLNLDGWGPRKVFSYVSRWNFDYESCINGLIYELDDSKKLEFKSKLKEINKVLYDNETKGIKTITLFDSVFPKKLYMSTDICIFLFYIGNVELLSTPSLAIIGTRKPTVEFIEKGIIASRYYSQKGYSIVSGLALGCDSIAHSECIKVNGKTIAVLPSPCDNPQPISNRQLAREIVSSGGLLISEYGTGMEVTKYNYPRRDRIQSLLSDVTLVIQASAKSGTMIAVNKSLKDKKKVFAIEGNDIPGNIDYVDVNDMDDLKKIERYL